MSARSVTPAPGRLHGRLSAAGAWVLALLLVLVIGAHLGGQAPAAADDEIRVAVERLASGEPDVWRGAMRTLVAAGERAVPALCRALRTDARPAVGARAARLLGDLGAASAGPDLRRRLGDPKSDPSVRRESARALGRLRDEPARPLLVSYLRTDLRVAARALGALGDDVAIPDLLEELARPLDGSSQVVLGEALGRLGARAGVDLLLDVAFRPDGEAVREAIRALKECVEPSLTVPERVVPDRTEIYRLQLRWNRTCTTMPLRTGPREPSAALRRRAKELVREALAESSPARARRREVVLIGMREASAEALVAAFGGAVEASRSATLTRMMVEMGPYGVGALVRALRSPEPRVKLGAVRTLGALPVQGRKFPALHGLLVAAETKVLRLLYEGGAAEPELRAAVVDLLGWIGAEASGFALAGVVRDRGGEPEPVRLAAARALGLTGAVASGRPVLWAVVEDERESRRMRCESAFAGALLLEPRAIGRLVKWLDGGGEPVEYLRRLSGWTWFGHEIDRKAAVERWKRWWTKYASVIRVDPLRVKRELLWERENEVFRRDLEGHWLAGLGAKARWIDRVDQEARCLGVAIRMVPTLSRIVAEDPDRWRRFHAVQMMSILGARQAVATLVDALDDRFALVRSTAAEGLGLIGQDFEYADYAAALRQALTPLLSDADAGCRAQASLALARLGFAEGIPVLIDLMESGPSSGLADFAWTAYRLITGKRDFDYNPAAGPGARRRAVEAMRAWWRREGAGFRPHVPRPTR